MSKLCGLAIVSVFVVWQIMDFIIHTIILAPQYAATASLWRPEGEMKMGLMMVVSLIGATCFCLVYDRFFAEKNLTNGALYGLIWGIGVGSSMGHGSYSVMPLPYALALGWFLATVAAAVVAGVLVGVIVKE
ncbi:MAG: hypothetical protein ABFS37_00405 [Acidobacteriota bacterium]